MRRTVPRAVPSSKCPVEQTLDIIGGRWKCIVLFHRRVPGATQRMLTRQLRELERDCCIERKVYPEVPPKVDYSLTPRGRTLEPVVKALCYWGMEHTAWANPWLEKPVRDNFLEALRDWLRSTSA